jgi:FtsH-binding integral membrane protein
MRAFWSKSARVGSSSPAQSGATSASSRLRVMATVLRAIFICSLILITVAVSLPQNETIWTIDDTPPDVVRLLLGLGVCVWLGIQLFKGPQDVQGYKTWMYLGLVAVPFALICLVYVWLG